MSLVLAVRACCILKHEDVTHGEMLNVFCIKQVQAFVELGEAGDGILLCIVLNNVRRMILESGEIDNYVCGVFVALSLVPDGCAHLVFVQRGITTSCFDIMVEQNDVEDTDAGYQQHKEM